MPGHKGAPQVISTMGSRRGFTYMPGHTGGAPQVVGSGKKMYHVSMHVIYFWWGMISTIGTTERLQNVNSNQSPLFVGVIMCQCM